MGEGREWVLLADSAVLFVWFGFSWSQRLRLGPGLFRDCADNTPKSWSLPSPEAKLPRAELAAARGRFSMTWHSAYPAQSRHSAYICLMNEYLGDHCGQAYVAFLGPPVSQETPGDPLLPPCLRGVSQATYLKTSCSSGLEVCFHNDNTKIVAEPSLVSV